LFLGGNSRLKESPMLSRNRHEWVEAAFLNLSDKELSQTGKNYLGLSLGNKKLVGFLLFIYFVLFVLLCQTAFIQVWHGDYYFNLAEKNRIRLINLVSPRGIIYDTNGIALVENVPSFAVFVTMFDLQADAEKEKTIAWLRQNLAEQETFEESLEKLLLITPKAKEYFEPVLLIEGLEYEKAMAMRIESVNYEGVDIEVTARRNYLNSFQSQKVSSLAHTLGYEGKINSEEYNKLVSRGYLLNDFVGKTGVEAIFEEQLRGKYGKEQIEVDSSGKAVKIIAREEMQKGDNLFLSIDLNMQAKLESIIKNSLAKLNKKKAVAIVMDPRNGKIRSLVNLPSYDNNLFSRGISSVDFDKLITDEDKPLFNRAVSGEYPSGSTIKPVIAAAALEQGIINENSSFLSVGGIRIGEWFFPDWKAGGHGITNVRKALAESVNTFFYIIGGGYGDFEGLGVRKIKEYAELFGLNALTGIDLPNEKAGFLPTPEWKLQTKKEQWYIGDSYHLAIGQGDLLVTPLQVANYISVFANNGILYKPQIIDHYFDQETKNNVAIDSEIIRQDFISDQTLNIVCQGMRQAVTSGSAKILNSLPVTSAAKTGTAQWSTDKNPHAWFAAFAPYNNAEMVIMVLVEEAGEGSAVSAPIAYEFMNWYFREYKK